MDLYVALIGWCARHRDRKSMIHDASSARAASMEDLAAARDRMLDEPGVIDAYVAENPHRLTSTDLGLVAEWREFVRGEPPSGASS